MSAFRLFPTRSGLRSQGAAREGTRKSGGPQRRSLCHRGMAQLHGPMALLAATRAVCRSAAAQVANAVVYDVSARALNLPSALMLEESHVDRVSSVLRVANSYFT